MPRPGNLGVGFESKLGAMDLSSEVSIETHGSEVGSKIRGFDLGAMARGADLPAMSAPLGCPILPSQASRRQPPGSKDQFTSPRGLNVNFLQKRAKLKKIGSKTHMFA